MSIYNISQIIMTKTVIVVTELVLMDEGLSLFIIYRCGHRIGSGHYPTISPPLNSAGLTGEYCVCAEAGAASGQEPLIDISIISATGWYLHRQQWIV